MTKKHREHISRVVESLKNYITAYGKQVHYREYTDSILIDDMLYGLGIAIDPDKYRFANGYKDFKSVLRKHLSE